MKQHCKRLASISSGLQFLLVCKCVYLHSLSIAVELTCNWHLYFILSSSNSSTNSATLFIWRHANLAACSSLWSLNNANKAKKSWFVTAAESGWGRWWVWSGIVHNWGFVTGFCCQWNLWDVLNMSNFCLRTGFRGCSCMMVINCED
jgi:hypothetical protein